MSFSLAIPTTSGDQLNINLPTGHVLFLLGANGTGKSALIQNLYAAHYGNAIRVAAHRRTWLQSSTLDLTPRQKQDQERNMRDNDRSPQSRWVDGYDGARASVALYNLIDAENVRARAALTALREHDDAHARHLADEDSPIMILNRLLSIANLPVTITISEGDDVQAQRDSGSHYSMAQMSDGERNAILLSAEVLTANPGTLQLIDEPERHLHRSIVVPLLAALFEARSDCTFVIGTHEVAFLDDFRDANVFLIRGCDFSGDQAVVWDIDVLESRELDEDVRRDILGARRTVLFVEGGNDSLDKRLYSVIFPNVSIVPKGNCREVERSVKGIRGASELHWVRAFGAIDSDNRAEDELRLLKDAGVHALDFYSVESIYYHPFMLRRAAERLASATGGDVEQRLFQAGEAGMAAIRNQEDHLVREALVRSTRSLYLANQPQKDAIDSATVLEVKIDVNAERAAQRQLLRSYIDANDLESIVMGYPIRESGALSPMARSLGFADRRQYEQAALKVVEEDEEARQWVLSLFGELPNAMSQTDV